MLSLRLVNLGEGARWDVLLSGPSSIAQATTSFRPYSSREAYLFDICPLSRCLAEQRVVVAL